MAICMGTKSTHLLMCIGSTLMNSSVTLSAMNPGFLNVLLDFHSNYDTVDRKIFVVINFHQSPSTTKGKQVKYLFGRINGVEFISSSIHSDQNKTRWNFNQQNILLVNSLLISPPKLPGTLPWVDGSAGIGGARQRFCKSSPVMTGHDWVRGVANRPILPEHCPSTKTWKYRAQPVVGHLPMACPTFLTTCVSKLKKKRTNA